MSKKPRSKINLAELINALPSPDVSNLDLKDLLLQLIVDTPGDDPGKHYSNRAKCKVEAIKLLIDINRNDNIGDYETELLDILNDNDDSEKE